jgi:hypothetical protein
MKTKNIILIILIAISLVLSLIIWNAFSVKRDFALFISQKHNFCIIVDNRYKYSYSNNILTYSGGKNSGRIELVPGGLSKDIFPATISDFVGGYKKLINFRIYEYILSSEFVLRDTFEIAKKIPVNLVPLRHDCEKIKTRIKKHIQIFN